MKKVTAGRDNLGDFAPQFAGINDDILFGQVWSKENEISAHNRSMITIAALIAMGNIEQLSAHLKIGKKNGISRREIVAEITHLSFYVGWPKAWSAFNRAKEIWTKDDKGQSIPQPGVFKTGAFNEQYDKYFKGNSYIKSLVQPQDNIDFGISNVTFEPSCRNNWHIHHDGYQILLVTGGHGWYQEAGKNAKALNPGDVVVTHQGIKHWHGAQKNSWFSHVAIGAGKTEWLESVSDKDYDKLS